MNGPAKPNVLDWDQVKDVALEAFDVWVSGGELRWAQDVWTKTVAAGMANYSDERERHRVGILFLPLAGLYRDFCAMAWDERNEPTYSYWAEELSLEAFVLGQLVGPDPGIEAGHALNHLVNTARSQVLELSEGTASKAEPSHYVASSSRMGCFGMTHPTPSARKNSARELS